LSPAFQVTGSFAASKPVLTNNHLTRSTPQSTHNRQAYPSENYLWFPKLTYKRAECVDLAPGLSGALYFKHLKNVLKTFKKL
jgi:hypothetical protein